MGQEKNSSTYVVRLRSLFLHTHICLLVLFTDDLRSSCARYLIRTISFNPLMTPPSSSVRPFLIPVESHMSSPKASNVSDAHDTTSNSPPPYSQSSRSPLLLAEMTTTRTETVTTTTTETTTHLFSLPYWKKRNGAQSSASQRSSIDNLSSSIASKAPTYPPFIDKALPPTPLESPDTFFATGGSCNSRASSVLPPPIYRSDGALPQSRKLSTGTQAAAALAHAALGIGLPHVGLPHSSASFPRPEASTIPFGSPASPSSPSPGIRRSKSSHRILSRRVSETQENVNEQPRTERRQRGLSFSSTSFLNIGSSDARGKGKDTEPASATADSYKQASKPLTRKSSFWNRRKGTEPVESMSPVQDNSVVLLPPLPPVHHVSPFDIHDFPDASLTSPLNDPSLNSNDTNRKHAESVRPLHPNVSSPEIYDVSISSRSWPVSQQTIPSNGLTESLQSNGNPASHSRPRRQTSTPFLHRLSLGVFSSGESSPSSGPTAIIYPQSATTFYAPTTLVPRRQETPIPRPLGGEEESPELYLSRLKDAVSKSEVAGILASR